MNLVILSECKGPLPLLAFGSARGPNAKRTAPQAWSTALAMIICPAGNGFAGGFFASSE